MSGKRLAGIEVAVLACVTLACVATADAVLDLHWLTGTWKYLWMSVQMMWS